MRRVWILTMVMAATAAQCAEPALTLVDQLIADNDAIRSVRCDIRRDVVRAGRSVPTLSRVWFERGDRLNVQTVTPAPRRILVDGEAIYKWIVGEDAGVRIPLSEAPEAELLQVRRVPASGEEYLRRLQGAAETRLPPSDEFPVRYGYRSPAPYPYAEVSMDASNRLARIEFFDPDTPTQRLLLVDFSGWQPIGEGLWMACHQCSEATLSDGSVTIEDLRVSHLEINHPIPQERFILSHEAPDITFLSREEMIKHLKAGDTK